MNEVESLRIGKTNETKNWFFQNIKKVNKPLARLIKRRKQKELDETRDKRVNKEHHRGTKYYNRVLQKIICQKIR